MRQSYTPGWSRFEPLEPRMLLSATTAIVGDYNGNGSVEQGDLDLVLGNWGENFVGNDQAVPSAWINDLPANAVDQAELDGVLSNWGRSIAAGATDGRLKALTSGETVRDFLGTVSDVDTFTIELDAGDSLLLGVSEIANAFSFLQATLFDPDGRAVEQIAPSASGDLEQLNVTQGGTYKVVVREFSGSGAGEYALTAVVVDEVIDAGNVALTSGATVTTLVERGDYDTFTIDASAGESLLVGVGEVTNAFSFIEAWLFGPDGGLIERIDPSSAGDLEQIGLTQSGRYTIVVNDFSNGATGEITLTAVVVDEVIDAGNVALTSGATVTTLVERGDYDTFTIDASAGESLLVGVGEVTNAFSFIEAWLFGPDGGLIERIDPSSAGDLEQIGLTQSGRYTIVVNDFSNGATGEITLTAVVVDEVIDAGNVALTSGQTVTTLVERGDYDTFTIDASAGESLLVGVGEVTNAFSFIEAWLFGPDGGLIERIDPSSAGDLEQIGLTRSGRYTIVVNDFSNGATGEITLTAVVVDEVIDAGNVALTSGQTVTTLVERGDYDTFTIDAFAGARLTVDVAEVTNTFSFIEGWLFSPSGALLDRIDPSSSGTLDSGVLSQSGRYTIVVNDFSNAATGDIRVSPEVAGPPVPPMASLTEASAEPVRSERPTRDRSSFSPSARASGPDRYEPVQRAPRAAWSWA